MAIGSITGVLSQPQTVFNQTSQSKPESTASEATETKAVTQKEAGKGDTVAKRKLAKEQVAEEATKGEEPTATAEGKGIALNTIG